MIELKTSDNCLSFLLDRMKVIKNELKEKCRYRIKVRYKDSR